MPTPTENHVFIYLFIASQLAGSQFPDQGWNPAPAVKALSTNHWTTREFPDLYFKKLIFTLKHAQYFRYLLNLERFYQHRHSINNYDTFSHFEILKIVKIRVLGSPVILPFWSFHWWLSPGASQGNSEPLSTLMSLQNQGCHPFVFLVK